MPDQRVGQARVPRGKERGAAGGHYLLACAAVLFPLPSCPQTAAAHLGENAMRFIHRFICHKKGNRESSWTHSPTTEQECFGTNLALTHGAGVARQGSSMLLAEGTAALGIAGHLIAQTCQGLGKGEVHLLHLSMVGSIKDLWDTDWSRWSLEN